VKVDQVHYIDLPTLYLSLSSKQNFFLIFNVNGGKDKYLNEIIQKCLEYDNCKGIIFQIDQDNFEFAKLFFLKALLEKLLINKKQVGIWGVPLCIPRTLFGGYLYMRFVNMQIKETFVIKSNSQAENFLPICEQCIDRDNCLGIGKIDIEAFKPVIKKIKTSTIEDNLHPFAHDKTLLNSMHEQYIKYCHEDTSSVSYRTVYYVSNIDFDSEHSYVDRFVYGCDYINPDEYKKEFDFLRKHTIHKKYVTMLEKIADIDRTSQIAYSLAQRDEVFRESFYMFVSKSYGDKVLYDMDINYVYPRSADMQFIGVGIDVINEAIEGYKLYFTSKKSFLKRYLEPFGIEVDRLSHSSHYIVLRLDRDQHFVSYKIEMLILYDDLQYFEHLIENYDGYKKRFIPPHLYNIAIEIVKDKISKINIYHRYYLAEKKLNAI